MWDGLSITDCSEVSAAAALLEPRKNRHKNKKAANRGGANENTSSPPTNIRHLLTRVNSKLAVAEITHKKRARTPPSYTEDGAPIRVYASKRFS
jgi:hypothetical protein